MFPTPEGQQLPCPPPQRRTASRSWPPSISRRARTSSTASVHDRAPVQLRRASARRRALGGKAMSAGNVRLAMSHVVPDLVAEDPEGPGSTHILGEGNQVRHYTYVATSRRASSLASNTPRRSTRIQRVHRRIDDGSRPAKAIWEKVHKGTRPLPHGQRQGVEYDVQRGCLTFGRLLRSRFEATTSLASMLEEVTWIEKEISEGTIREVMAVPELSVIIRTFNNLAVLRRCLESWERTSATSRRAHRRRRCAARTGRPTTCARSNHAMGKDSLLVHEDDINQVTIQ